MIEKVAPATIVELTAISRDCSTLYFGIGTFEDSELLGYIAANLGPRELLVVVEDSAGCLAEIEAPEQLPAIGAWCSKGALIDFGYNLEGVADLMKDARRFAT